MLPGFTNWPTPGWLLLVLGLFCAYCAKPAPPLASLKQETAARALATGYAKSYAVVIGIESYENKSVSRLAYAKDDAQAVGRALAAGGFDEVIQIVDEEATLGRIRQVLAEDLPRKLKPDDRVLIYFSGHGDDTRSNGQPMGYLVPVDGNPDRLRATGLSMEELQSWLDRYAAKHVMFVADACYSGLAIRTKSLGLPLTTPGYLRAVTTEEVRYSLVAGGHDEEAIEDDRLHHGVFTHYFLEALDRGDSNGDGAVTSLELANYVSPRVAEHVAGLAGYGRRPQRPDYRRAGRGEFVFYRNPRQPAPPRIPSKPSPPVTRDDLFDFEVGGVEVQMRYIPAGSFLMGSPESDGEAAYPDERPQHRVTLTKGFWLAETECTQALWQAVMGDNPSRFKGAQRPVEMVSWDNVQAFIQKLNSRVPNLNARLPTEAEWEHAARAGTTESRYGELDAIAWYGSNSGNATHPVAQKQPNAWGLYDMLGNVYEWTADAYDRDFYGKSPATDPSNNGGRGRGGRGGSWLGGAGYVRAAFRGYWQPGHRRRNLGFRLARGHEKQ